MNLKNKLRNILKIIGILFLLFFISVIFYFSFIYFKHIRYLPWVKTLEQIKVGSNYLAYDNIPKKIINTLVATEDKYFFSDYAFSLNHMSDDMWKLSLIRWLRWQYSQITYSLVRLLNEKASNYSNKPLDIKITSSYYLNRINNTYSKNEILELYFNHVTFLEWWFNFQESVKELFNKKIDELDNNEISILMSLPRWPEYYSPYKNYSRLIWEFYSDKWSADISEAYMSFGIYNSDLYFDKFIELELEQNWENFEICSISTLFTLDNYKIENNCIEIKQYDLYSVLSWLSFNDGTQVIKYNYWKRWFVLSRMLIEWIITFEDFKKTIIEWYWYKFN